MTDPRLQAIGRLVADLFSAHDAEGLAALWGEPQASQTRPGGLAVECVGVPGLASLEIRPWATGTDGLVDIRWQGDAPRWADVQDRFGPFIELDTFEIGVDKYGVTITNPEGRAVTLLVSLVDAEVAEFAIRRDFR